LFKILTNVLQYKMWIQEDRNCEQCCRVSCVALRQIEIAIFFGGLIGAAIGALVGGFGVALEQANLQNIQFSNSSELFPSQFVGNLSFSMALSGMAASLALIPFTSTWNSSEEENGYETYLEAYLDEICRAHVFFGAATFVIAGIFIAYALSDFFLSSTEPEITLVYAWLAFSVLFAVVILIVGVFAMCFCMFSFCEKEPESKEAQSWFFFR